MVRPRASVCQPSADNWRESGGCWGGLPSRRLLSIRCVHHRSYPPDPSTPFTISLAYVIDKLPLSNRFFYKTRTHVRLREHQRVRVTCIHARVLPAYLPHTQILKHPRSLALQRVWRVQGRGDGQEHPHPTPDGGIRAPHPAYKGFAFLCQNSPEACISP